MKHFIAVILLTLTIPLEVWSERKTKTLIHAQKIDVENERLGQSIETELKHKIVKGLFADNDTYINKKVFEGLEYIDFNVKKDFVEHIFRAYADTSYYDDIQIKEVKDFLLKNLINLCKFKEIREKLFLLNMELNYVIVDKVNKPFISLTFNKEVCREIEPYGRYRSISKRALWKLKNNK